MERIPSPSLNYAAMNVELEALVKREPALRAELRRLTPRSPDVTLSPAAQKQLREARLAHEDAVVLIRYYRAVLSSAGWSAALPSAA